jgi:hypothetical protein
MINMKGLYLHNYQMLQVPIYSWKLVENGN